MESPLKLGKHVEDPRSEDCLDMISNLPDELLGYMLSFLPTKYAVSTSIFSTRWRYLFTLTNCLSFDDLFAEIETDRKIMFENFVYKVLALHQISPIKKFSLACQSVYDESDLNVWVSNAIQKGVQELHYQVVVQMDVLPDCLFMCETLVKLKMIFCMRYNFEIPLSARFPKLKILHLENVGFLGNNSVQRLISSCKLLEELTLNSCHCYIDGCAIISTGLLKVLTIEHCFFPGGLLEVDAPNLEYLTYSCNTGVKIVPSWKESCCFVKAELTFSYSVDDGSNDKYLRYDSELLKDAAYKATNLCLFKDSVERLLTLVDHEKMPDFHSLSRLQLSDFPYYAWKYLTSLIDKSPRLETVIFEGFEQFYSDTLSPPNEALNPFSCHVKVIEVHYYSGCKYSLLYMGHLLRNAGVLKTLIVYILSDSDLKDEQIKKDLLMLPRASRACCIDFKERD